MRLRSQGVGQNQLDMYQTCSSLLCSAQSTSSLRAHGKTRMGFASTRVPLPEEGCPARHARPGPNGPGTCASGGTARTAARLQVRTTRESR